MNQQKKLEKLETASYFSKSTLQQVVEVGDNALYTNIKRWLKGGQLVQLKRGMYVTGEYVKRCRDRESYGEFVANRLKWPSYLSLEYVLQKKGVMSESVYSFTSVSLKRPNEYTNVLGRYLYYYVKPELYTGYGVVRRGGYEIREASLAKALFDYFYLKLRRVGRVDGEVLDSYRLNTEVMTRKDRQEFRRYVKLAGVKKMKIVEEYVNK